MKAALRKYAEEMREAGFDYNHPDEVDVDIKKRLDAILGGGTPLVEKLSADQQASAEKVAGI